MIPIIPCRFQVNLITSRFSINFFLLKFMDFDVKVSVTAEYMFKSYQEVPISIFRIETHVKNH